MWGIGWLEGEKRLEAGTQARPLDVGLEMEGLLVEGAH